MSDATTHEVDPKVEFIEICEASLGNAISAFPAILMDASNVEPLGGIAKSCYDAFYKAMKDYAEQNALPTVSGNDSHNFASEVLDRTADAPNSEGVGLAFALNAVYGFVSEQQATVNPQSINALKALQPIAHAIHTSDFAICT